MEKIVKIIRNKENSIKAESRNNKHYFTINNKINDKNKLLLSSKMIQVDLIPYKTLSTLKSKGQKFFRYNKPSREFNKDILNLKSTFNYDKSVDLLITNDKKSNKSFIQNQNKIKSNSKENDINNKKNQNFNLKSNESKSNLDNKNNTINSNILNKKIFSPKNKYNSRNNIPKIIQPSLEMTKQNINDITLKNLNELKYTFNAHMRNQDIFKKYEKRYSDKNNIDYNSSRKYYFGKKTIDGLPYYYDISSTYMNMYDNKSEQNRHEVLIQELCKLRAYLSKYKIENSTDVIKDFLIKHNIPNIHKYSNYQLMQFGRFVCQEDTYKMNSLLKPYMNVKDMINDILNNSENLNEKFSIIKYNPSLKKSFSDLKINKSQPFLQRQLKKIPTKKIFKPRMKKNKKFYISELDYSTNKSEKINQMSDNVSKNENELNKKNLNNNINDEDKKDLKNYNINKSDNINQMRIGKKYLFSRLGSKDSYLSPLIKINNFHKKYINSRKKIKLPKISNNISTFYKPNKLLLSSDKNYSLNFGLLLKDTINEIKIFQKDYEKKFDVEIQSYLGKNFPHSNSYKNIYSYNDSIKKKKLEENNRLFFGKKSIKASFREIQKKQKLTEYIAFLNAKNRIKNEIINNNEINY